MSKQSSDSSEGKGPARDRSIDESQLAQLLLQPWWYPEQAAQVLGAQAQSGQSVCQYAKQHGISASRLYYWKRRLPPEPVAAGAREREQEQQAPVPSVKGAGLDLEKPSERHAYEYVEWMTSGEQPTWRLLDIRRQGRGLLLVVRWAKSVGDPKPYSLVEVDLLEPAVRWRDYPSVDVATEALSRRCGLAVEKSANAEAPPLLARLIKVEVKGQTEVQRPEQSTQAAHGAATCCITVCMESGVRIKIPPGVPKELLSAVVWALRNQPC